MTDTRFQTNDRLTYSDMANPGTEYIVVAVHDNPWSTYELRNIETGETEWTDGRQAGWTLTDTDTLGDTMNERKTLNPENVEAGEGVTLNCWSDSQSHTLIEVLRNGKQIVIQRDSAVRSNQDQDTFSPGGFAGHIETPGGQKWTITPDGNGSTFTANWSAKRNRFFVGGPKGLSVTAGRYEHYDYNF